MVEYERLFLTLLFMTKLQSQRYDIQKYEFILCKNDVIHLKRVLMHRYVRMAEWKFENCLPWSNLYLLNTNRDQTIKYRLIKFTFIFTLHSNNNISMWLIDCMIKWLTNWLTACLSEGGREGGKQAGRQTSKNYTFTYSLSIGILN